MFKKKNILWFIFALLVATSFFIVRLFIQQGEFQTIAAQSDYQCTRMQTAYGPEDVFADYQTGLLYISASARHDAENRYNMRGDIYVLNMNDEAAGIKLASVDMQGKFRPHGISLIKLESGAKRLFAISHPAAGESQVEVFNVVQGKLTHLNTITGLTGGLNSIVALDGERFYATQDGSTKGISSLVNGVLNLKYSEVIYYDGTTSKVVADGFAYANGIELSSDGKTLYVSDTLDRTLTFFDRDLTNNELTQSGSLYLDAGGDNIRRNRDGNFFIAGHPKMFSSFFYLMGLTDMAPTAIFNAIPPKDGQGGELRMIHLEEGGLMSAASGAVKYRDKMYVASVVDPFILSCVVK